MSAPKKVLLFGGHGQLGVAIRRSWQTEIVAPRHQELDIEHIGAVTRTLDAIRPGVLINCASFHNVEACETNAAQSLAVNAVAVNGMAEACAERGIPFVTFSTDYVFDGTAGRPYTEDDATHPLSVYATSKLAGELLVLRLDSPAYVIRTCGVYGERESTGKGHTFVQRVITQKRAGERVRVVNDQVVSPTFAGDLAHAVRQMLDAKVPYGLYHCANEGAVTWYEFAREALCVAGLNDEIEPVSHTSWASKVRRPAFSALENARLHALGFRMPDWRDGLAKYTAALT